MVLSQSLSRVRQLWRNSPWLVIAVALHVAVIAVVSIVTYRELRPKSDDQPIRIAARAPDEQPPVVEPEPDIPQRNDIPKPVEVELVPDDIRYFPDVDARADLTKEIGDPDISDFDPNAGTVLSTAIGPGQGGIRGHGPGTGPSMPGNGTPKGGSAPIAPPEATEKAVLAGLTWLVRHQADDGSWSLASLHERCSGDARCASAADAFTSHYDEGLTGLALLCFLGAGFDQTSKAWITDRVRGERHRVGEVVKQGLQWLVDRQKDDGSYSQGGPFTYNEALAAMAMCEAYGLSGARIWRHSAERAIAFLVRGQKLSPFGDGAWGWRYGPREELTVSTHELSADQMRGQFESDTSVTTWVVMALKSAQLAGLEVPRASFDGALAFVRWTSRPDGLVGYLDPDAAGSPISGKNDHFTYHTASMSALSMCTRIFAAHDPDDPFLDKAAAQLLRDLPAISRDKLSIDYYYWYYGSLALNQLDGPDSPRHSGKYWGPWNKAMVAAVLGLQESAQHDCREGAWLVPDRWSYAGGPIYTTAINVLTLEVYYRYANAFGVPRGIDAAPAPKAR